MAIQINLLQNQKDYNRLDNYFRIGRLTVAVFCAICLVTLIVVFCLKQNAQSTLDEALDRRNSLQAEINSLQDQETRIILINEKMEAMNEILKDVPDYSREVETFLAFMPQATSSATIDRIALDGRAADITLSFEGVIPLSSFIGIMESPQFQESFETIQVGAIHIHNFNDTLQLSLDVTFK